MRRAAVAPVLGACLVLASTPFADDIYEVRRQDGSVVLTNVPPVGARSSAARRAARPAPPDPAVSGGAGRPYEEFVRQVAGRYGVDVDLVHAIIAVESNYNPVAVSARGAIGLMQLMPETARELGVRDPVDPWDNIVGGVRHLRRLLEYYQGDVTLSIAAYNAGAGAVDRHHGVPPFGETRDYVRRIRRRYRGGGMTATLGISRDPIYRLVDSDGLVRYTQFPSPAGPPPDALGWKR